MMVYLPDNDIACKLFYIYLLRMTLSFRIPLKMVSWEVIINETQYNGHNKICQNAALDLIKSK